MFTLDQSNVLRIQLCVPRDAAIGVKPGIDTVVRVPGMPDRAFPGKITQIADALNPATRTLLTEIDLPIPTGDCPRGCIADVLHRGPADSTQDAVVDRAGRGDRLRRQRPPCIRGRKTASPGFARSPRCAISGSRSRSGTVPSQATW